MDDVLDGEAAQDDAAWRARMDAACTLDGELDAEEALVECIADVLREVCAPALVEQAEPQAPEPTDQGQGMSTEGRCERCRGPRPSYLASCCRSCLDAMRDRNRLRQGFKGRVYTCSTCWATGHNARTCPMREVML